MQALIIVPELFRDRRHLQQVHRRVLGLSTAIAVSLVAVIVVGLVARDRAGEGVMTTLVSALLVLALLSLWMKLRKLVEVEPVHLMTFIESCDQDRIGEGTAEVSSRVAELYADQGFVTKEQFVRLTAILHGSEAQASGLMTPQFAADDVHDLG